MNLSSTASFLQPTIILFPKTTPPPIPHSILTTKNPFFFLKLPSRTLLLPPCCCTAALHTSPHRRRPPRRRNSLRDKLPLSTEVRTVPSPSTPNPSSTNSSPAHDETVDTGPIYGGKTELWDRLESWVDGYKEDSELWGIGTGPIFTVYQHSDGSIAHVDVNVEEITKRSRIGALSFKQKEPEEEAVYLHSKISRANLMAKEIETGERVLPKSSSIAKFVVKGAEKMPGSSSFVDRIRFVSLRGEELVKVMPRAGFAVLCGCCILWAVKKLFVGSGGAEITREETEMLRRKKKFRMEREKLEKRRVEVIQNAAESTMGSTSRPQLDKGELMKSIMQAKASGENLTVSGSSSQFSANGRDFDDKVSKIRQLARRVRELEQRGQQENDREEVYDGDSIQLSAKDVTATDDVYIEAKSLKNGSYHAGLSEYQTPSVASNDPESKEKIIEDNVDSIRDTPDVTVNVDGHKIDRKTPIGIGAENPAHCSNSSSPSMKVLGNEKSTGQNEMESNIKGKKEASRRKLKVIRSVKDARGYLAEKHRMSTETGPTQESQFKTVPTGHGACDSTYDKKNDNETIRTVNESIKVVELSKKNKLWDDDAESDKFFVEAGDSEVQRVPEEQSEEPLSDNKATHSSCLTDPETSKIAYLSNIYESIDSINGSTTLGTANSGDDHNNVLSQTRNDRGDTFRNRQALESLDTLLNTSLSGGSPRTMKQFTEDGVCEPRELNALSNNGHPYQEAPVEKLQDRVDVCNMKSNRPSANKDWTVSAMVESSESDTTPDLTLLGANSSDESSSDVNCFPLSQERTNVAGELGASPIKSALHDSPYQHDLKDSPMTDTSFPQDSDGSDSFSEALSSKTEEPWVEKNFQQFDPIIKKIGIGFKENYMVAKEKVQDQPSLRPELSELGLMVDDEELEWMEDESLRKIVFQVRENELAGRNPFHLMNDYDQHAFFEGLQRKAEKVNEKLLGLHEWVHSRIENLDYGADGISLDDPLEKTIPRWKGSSIDRDPEFIQKVTELQTGNGGNPNRVKVGTEMSLDKPEDMLNANAVSPYSPVNGRSSVPPDGASTTPKTLIECSDGSSRPGKKTGKEHWQHTKKWSQGFLDVYNAETDPEIKSIMKDMGKDLDKWITEKEKKDVADLMTRISKKKRRYIEKKMKKLKREMEMFGAPAVVSKYKEYSDEKEEDYLWWLDLDFVLCIELYTIEDGVPKIGFYSLEMAADLEMNPKQYHVVAFEDPGDSKNFCYILQAHMDTLGSGKAFVVARPPKDAFREAKGNGFSVTIIRRGELKLNVDQTLEEVEEEIAEIGSKIYHDKIMRDRSVDIYGLMKGVITADKSRKSRSQRMLMKPAKS